MQPFYLYSMMQLAFDRGRCLQNINLPGIAHFIGIKVPTRCFPSPEKSACIRALLDMGSPTEMTTILYSLPSRCYRRFMADHQSSHPALRLTVRGLHSPANS